MSPERVGTVCACCSSKTIPPWQDRPPEIIFLDIRLPKLDGFGVLEALREDSRTRQVPVVILSNYSERQLVERGLRLGALEYLIKTQTTPAHLSRNLETWLKE